MKRQVIRIDESKCTGCGLCIPNCAEGSLEIRDGKAVLVKEALCDGLGACLGHCPEGALTIEERDADAFDEELVHERLAHLEAAGKAGRGAIARRLSLGESAGHSACEVLGSLSGRRFGGRPLPVGALARAAHPVPPNAAFLEGADLLLSADCAPFAYAGFHRDFIKGHAVAVACPKLDNAGAHFQKLIQVFRQAGLRSVTVVRMEVPCCGGLTAMVSQALAESGSNLPVREVVIGRDGTVVEDRPLLSTGTSPESKACLR